MLGKLLKYDFRALNRVMVPLQLGVLVAGIVGCFLMNFSIRSLSSQVTSSYSSVSPEYSTLNSIINATSSMLSMLIFALVFASAYVTLFLIARHIYNNFIKDEAYLTFTLPVTTNQHLLSKIISGGVWMLVNAAILVLVVVLFTLIGASSEGLISISVLDAYGQLLEHVFTPLGSAFTLELIILCIAAVVFTVMQIYFSLILGGTLARTYKVFAAVGIYFLANIVLQTIISIVTFASMFPMMEALSNTYSYTGVTTESSWFYAAQPFVLGLFVLFAICIVVFYFISKHMLDNKLNLD